MWNSIFEWIRSAWKKMFTSNDVKKALNIDVSVSPLMQSALQLWSAMYTNTASWINADIKSMGLPAAISGEISRMVTVEMTAEVTGSPRADFLNTQLADIVRLLKNQKVEYGLAKGGLIIKPYIRGDKIASDYVTADCFYPVEFDSSGNIQAVVFADVRKQGQYWYTRLESHRTASRVCVIRNAAFRSSTENTLGSPCPLSEVADWAELAPEAQIQNVDAPLYGYFRFPSPNNIDPLSLLGVSCFSHAQDPSGNVKLIEQADEIYSNLVWEFQSGKRAIYAGPDAFEKGTDKKPKLPDKKLYRVLDVAPLEIGKPGFFHDWTPEFREASIKSGLDAVLKRIEFACRLAYGTISDPQTVDKTATEIVASQQRSYVTVTSTQQALQAALDQTLYAMDVYATLYNLAPRGNYAAVYQFDDSVITDKDSQFSKDMQAKTGGMMPGYIFLMRNYKLDEPTAKKWIADQQAEAPETDLFAGA